MKYTFDASMRPPPASGGYQEQAATSIAAKAASMRPPPASGGYQSPHGINSSACSASMRPPPASGGYAQAEYNNYNTSVASMRPPPASGGYRAYLKTATEVLSASMRPPPASGGYCFPAARWCAARCFNEAAARKRRIQRARNASCANGSRGCLREPRAMITHLPVFAPNRDRQQI